MGPADDSSFEMADLGAPWPRHSFFDPLALDEGTASRILDGLGQADVPPGYVGLAKLLAAASAPAQADELELEATVIAAFVAEDVQTAELPTRAVELPTRTTAPRSRRRRGRIVRALVAQKVAVAAVAGGLVVGGGVAAAATGSLPGAAQGVASQVLGFVGIDVPGPNSSAGHHPDTRGSSGSRPTPAAAVPPSADPWPTSCTAPCGAQLPVVANGSPGAAGSGPPVGTPEHGGTGTANSPRNGASTAGTTTANTASGRASSGGASSVGSGNAGSHPGPGAATGSSGRSDSGGPNGGASNGGSHPGSRGANSSSQGQAHGKPHGKP